MKKWLFAAVADIQSQKAERLSAARWNQYQRNKNDKKEEEEEND